MRTLVADDDRVATAILSKALTRCGIQVTVVHDGAAAWQRLDSLSPPSLAILDWMMPNLDGIELCRRVRRTPRLAGTYIILLTGRDSRADLVTALEAGADDYMVKPIHLEELQARVGVGLRVATLQHSLIQSVAELRTTRDHLTELASTDMLTGVYTRRWWFDLAAKELSRSRRYGRELSVLMTDLDWFKNINDRHGHETGDRVLQLFGTMLRQICRQSDIIGRLGGEEFALALPETGADAAQQLANRITDSCRSLVTTDAASSHVLCSCSVGVASVRSEADDIEGVLKRADGALYQAKRDGRGVGASQHNLRIKRLPARSTAEGSVLCCR